MALICLICHKSKKTKTKQNTILFNVTLVHGRLNTDKIKIMVKQKKISSRHLFIHLPYRRSLLNEKASKSLILSVFFKTEL